MNFSDKYFHSDFDDQLFGLETFSPANDEIPLNTEEQIRDVYGDWFCSKVGIKYLLQMPQVTAGSLLLQTPPEYPKNMVLLQYLQKDSVVKGLDGWNRPFIAIKIEQYNNKENKIYKYVELIFKRYSIADAGKKGAPHENNYVSALSNMCDDGISRDSMIYQTAKKQDWTRLGDLMEGKLVRTSLMGSIQGYIRLCQ